MPIITVDGPKVADLDSKRTFVQQMTAAASTMFDLPPETIIILFKENTPEDVSVGGTLIIDR
ncbi:MAG: 4-oxalocrotonate tautomerase [Desulfuromonas sp.]|nr:MAG: 4-oxalocrotonate tautomerase [Desulfuromonas sp.]